MSQNVPINQHQKILRIFFQHSVELSVYIEKGKIQGIIYRQDLIERLSDLADTRGLPIRKPESLEKLLDLLHKHGQINTKEEGRFLPVINTKLEYVGLWGNKELITAWETIKPIDIWQPPTISQQDVKLSNLGIKLPSKKIKIEFETNSQAKSSPTNSFVENESTFSSKQVSPNKKIKIETSSDNIDYGKIAISALESLSIPLLALDKKGQEIFHNEEWQRIEKKYDLSIYNLFEIAKEKSAQLAIAGKLNPNQAIILKGLSNHEIIFRTMFHDKKSIGFIIWVRRILAKNIVPTLKMETGSKVSPKEADEYREKKLSVILAQHEYRIFKWALSETGGNQSQASLLLGIPRQTFSFRYRKIKRILNIES